MADLVGRKLGPYEIRAVIGHGGMATVYRAYQPALNRYVAIKVLNAVMSHDAEFVARFHREALAAGGLDHPNILRIYDAGVFEEHQYIVMALAPGGPLSERLREAALPYNAAADLIAQVADALSYAHRRQIVHRDIKPSNILLDEEGRPLLADFGIAQALSEADARLTQTGASIGTPDYMSPEQAEGARVDGRSDLFSLGIVLYQIATGKLPFKAETTMGTMFQIVHHIPPAPRTVNPNVPAYLDSIIQKALAKRPEDRFQSGQELAQALRQRQVVPVPPPPVEWDAATQVIGPAPRRTPKTARRPATAAPGAPGAGAPAQPRRRGLLFTFLALALVAVLAAGYFAVVALNARVTPQTAGLTTEPPAGPTAPPPTAAPSPTEARPSSPPPTRRAGVVVAGAATVPPTATPPPADTPTPAPSQTPVVVIITVMATLPPTATPADTATARPPTAAPPTATRPAVKPTATTPAVPLPPGAVLNFETLGAWRIGNEKNGEFTQSNEQVHGGQFAAKLAYHFPAVNNNYVVFRRNPPAPIAGQPAALYAYVYGDGAGHFLNVWVRDAGAEVRQFTFGRIYHTGWQELAAALDTTAAWPQAHISGPDNGRLDFPITLDGFVLDGVPDGGGPFTGVIYIDDVRGGGAPTGDAPTGAAPAAGAAPPVAAASPKAPAAAAPAAPAAGALSGRIVYANSTGGVSVLDVASKNTWPLADNVRQPNATADGRVVMDGTGGGRNNLVIARLDGSATWIPGMHPEDSYASWSPTGTSAAFHSQLQGDGKDRIYIQQDMGHAEEPRRLQINKTDVFGKYATWLPNGRIAFTGCNYWAEGSRCGIWTANSDDSGAPARVTDNPGDISTDSTASVLLFAAQRSGNWDVYAVSVNGGEVRNLTASPAQECGATFSPDGSRIAFIANRDGGWGIWVMNADGGSPQKLLSVPGFGPNWSEERLSWTS